MTNIKTFSTYLNTLKQKGDLAYEYNPFHNYQTDKTLYLVDDTFLVPEDCIVNINNGEILTKYDDSKWVDKRGKIVEESDFGNIYKKAKEGKVYATAGSIIDLDTELLNFDLEHPVNIEVLPSYDGSVNLIFNDNKNIPRLINSRFSVREKGTYEIVDRIGENDTNIYDEKYFDNDTSLYFQYTKIPIIEFEELTDGLFPVGLYCFYITYCDSDNNESDIVGESNLIPMFIGGEGIPFSMEGGIKNERSAKGVLLKISNLDTSYNYIKIKYVRYFADYEQNRVFEGKEIVKKYEISNYEDIYITITGYEETLDFDPNILNLVRFNPKSILTQAQCKNMLFFGNITKITDNYRELSDLSLRIIPKIKKETLELPNNSYSGSEGYYDPINMYYKVGYFNQEYYSFGVVYIYKNGTLSNVYPTLGYVIDDNSNLTLPSIYNSTYSEGLLVRNYLDVDNEGWISDDSVLEYSNKYLNAKGVCKINYSGNYTSNDIFSVEFDIPSDVSKYLSDELDINGYFFVRLKCTPNIIAQCYLMPFDEVLKAPVLVSGNEDKTYYTECFVSLKKTTTEVWKNSLLIDDSTKRYTIEKTETIYSPKKITHNYDVRLRAYDSDWEPSKLCYAGICPDFMLNQPYYNLIFNSSDFRILKVSNDSYLKREGRFWKENENVKYQDNKISNTVTICTVTDDVPSVVIKDKTYKLRKGQTEEAVRFEYVQQDSGEYNVGSGDGSTATDATNISRGMYSPFLAIYSDTQLEIGQLYNIYSSTVLNDRQEILNRLKSSEPYYAISDRKTLLNGEINSLQCYRGDCFVNTFTHRLNRNFNDPSLPNNDIIVDENTWDNNYSATDSSKWNDIILSDLNAVKMGSWITFKCRSAQNYALRSVDHSHVSEEALMGAPRSFYPKSSLLALGENKMPDSYLYNDAYRATLGYKCYFALNDVNYIKDNFSNRIQYSAVAIQDSFKNNYRESYSTYFRDYSMEYGSIQKLVGFEGYLLVIFEHGIGVAVINERILAGGGDGEPVFINTQNVLPEELIVITDTYGTLWPESVVKSEAGYVYGVDTIAKKIWRVKGLQIEILSDFKVNKFLIDNISLGERERNPIIGLKNVKTHYNNNKKDIMFTFYDDVYKDEEKVWNLCYNELLGEFITFYSWIPSYSENIDTQFFSFSRDTSKWLSLLNYCNYSVPKNTGVLLDSPVIKIDEKGNYNYPSIYYCIESETQSSIPYTLLNDDGTVSTRYISNDNIEKYDDKYTIEKQEDKYIFKDMSFQLEKDHWGYYKYFTIRAWGCYTDGGECKEYGWEDEKEKYEDYLFEFICYKLCPNDEKKVKELLSKNKCLLLYITPYYSKIENIIHVTGQTLLGTCYPTLMVAITTSKIVENPLLTNDEKQQLGLTTDFYLHGQAGIFNITENTYPTYWYGEQHPFEFEVIVNDKVAQLKLFSNLVLISNKAEPESFHFEIEADNYDFSMDKRTMYFRLEATKNLYLNLGSDILYNRKFTDVIADKYTLELNYRLDKYDSLDNTYPTIDLKGLIRQVKSSMFPLYYERRSTYNKVYDDYLDMKDGEHKYDFANLSGSELIWNRDLNQFNVITHIQNKPINLYGRLRGNSYYKEGCWNVQIPSITYSLKNEKETDWIDVPKILEDGPLNGHSKLLIPPIVINSEYIPDDITKDLTIETLPNIYVKNTNLGLTGYIDLSEWTSRQEAKIRDKWMKVRVRYSGKNLAIIHSLITLYNI